jgi:hypothetical protein
MQGSIGVAAISPASPAGGKIFFAGSEPFPGCSDQWVSALDFINPNTRRTTMSRKLTLTLALATAATIAAASLASTTADARGFGGGFGGGRSFAGGGFRGGHIASSGRTLTPILGRTGNPGRIANPRFPRWPGHHWAYHPHGHLVFRGGRWITIDDVVDDVVEAPVTPVPGPCTCLTKNYTADGLVVFADVCTKEAASARVDGSASEATPVPPADKSSDATDGQSSVAAAPTSPNYAGRTYQDFLAANKQAASQENVKN